MTVPTKARRASRVAWFRKARSAQPWRPYDALMPEDALGFELADSVVASGWKHANLPVVELDPPIAWDEVCAANRSWAFHLHSWDPLGPVLTAYEETRSARYADFALAVARDWALSFPSLETDSEFAWYDMAVGVRAYRLAYLLDVVARNRRYRSGDVELLLESLALHRTALAHEEWFQGHNNHGIYQASGQLALAERFPELSGAAEEREQALERLRGLFSRQFSSEGVHLEHSPGYHASVLSTLGRLLRAGLVSDPELVGIHDRAEDALAWFVYPNGTLPTIGDGDRHFDLGVPPERLRSGRLRHAVTGGKLGEPARERLKAFSESGYAVCRSWDPPGGPASGFHLIHTAAFHSRTHKHADDLGFVWYDRGVEILVDPGRYGYLGRTEGGSDLYEQGFWYADPHRVYVESTRAHNTVEVDGRSRPRKDVEPFGSALRRFGETAGILWCESETTLLDSVRHARLLALLPGEWLLVFDAVADAAGADHDWVQRFHLAPELDARHLGDGLSVALPELARSLYMAPLLEGEHLGPVRGQHEPELLGWTSREYRTLTPSWTDGYAVRGISHVFATLFAFCELPPVARRDFAQADPAGTRARLSWSTGPDTHTIELDRGAKRLRIAYAGPQAPEATR